MTIPKATLHRVLTVFAQTFILFSIVVIPFWHRTPESWPTFLLTILLIPALFSLFPLIINEERSQRLVAEHNRKQTLWRESYRHSPAANLLSLHD